MHQHFTAIAFGRIGGQNIGAKLSKSTETEFEAMHPRFTAVNMYRKMCEREHIEFKRNKIVDNIGVILEQAYDDARTK